MLKLKRTQSSWGKHDVLEWMLDNVKGSFPVIAIESVVKRVTGVSVHTQEYALSMHIILAQGWHMKQRSNAYFVLRRL